MNHGHVLVESGACASWCGRCKALAEAALHRTQLLTPTACRWLESRGWRYVPYTECWVRHGAERVSNALFREVLEGHGLFGLVWFVKRVEQGLMSVDPALVAEMQEARRARERGREPGHPDVRGSPGDP